MQDRVGEVIAERFELRRLAGHGGMGAVYEALDRATGTAAAVKLLLGESSRPRFEREARLLAKLDHPAIVRQLAHGTLADGAPWLAMEWLDGEDLDERLAAGPLSVEDTYAVLRRAADALGAAHRLGMVHRDVKPANLFIRGGDPRRTTLLDFGIAQSAATSLTLTRAGMLVGTVGYMAPEQARGAPNIDARADVFALGCVLYECLTGRPPFVGDHPLAILAQVLLEEPPDPREACPACPAELAALVRRMLAKDPSARPADGLAVLDSLGASAECDVPAPRLTGAEQSPRALVLFTRGRGDADATVTPEELAAKQAPIAAIAEAHGGVLVPLADASSLVLFASSASGAMPDLAERATRCALALVEAVPDGRAAVALGSAEVQGRWPVGPVVDRAAALALRVSEVGVVAVDDAIERMLGERIAARERARLRGMTGGPAEEAPRGELPLVGRARELAFLEAMLGECASEPSAQVAMLIGPPGAGKTRLRRAMTERADAAGWDVLVVRGDPVYAHGPLGLLRQLAALDPSSELSALLSDGERGLDEGADERVAQSVARWMSQRASRRPQLVAIEDLHWCDDASVRALERTVAAHRDSIPLLILATARPELEAPFEGVDAQRLTLGPLKAAAARELVVGALPSIDPLRAAHLVAQAQGNAFVLEELIRHEREGGGESLPVSALAVAHSRLDRLEPDARKLLRAGAVFGEAFWAGGIVALLADDRETVDRRLASLVRRELLERVASSRFEREDELRFCHGLLREASYATLTAHDREVGHRLAAGWLERAGEADAQVIAVHYERGGEPARAAPYFLSAAERALRAGSLASAKQLVDRTLAAGAEGVLRGEALRVRALASTFGGDPPEHIAAPAIEAIERLPHGSVAWLEAVALLAYSVVFGAQLQHREALLASIEGLTDFEPGYLSGSALQRLGAALVNLGEIEHAMALLARMEARRGSERSFDGFLDLTIAYAGVFGLVPHESALPAALRATSSFAEHEDAVAHPFSGYICALAELEAGLIDAARERAERVVRQCTELGITTCLRWAARWLLGQVHLARGEAALARAHFEAVASSSDRIFAPLALAGRAVCRLRDGDVEAALLDGEASVEASRASPIGHVGSLVALALIHLKTGQRARARELAMDARELSGHGCMRQTRLQIEHILLSTRSPIVSAR